ncbi:MAG: FAD-dependent oxidoreductase [Spirochaetaceae bacterium]|nr:MAG: FAD-dependent oxidoreductase [Spirochaetaceae bacterium]
MDNLRIDTEVLVIGGGGAGLIAAVEARKKGAEVLILCKKDTGKSGCTPYAVTNLTYSTPDSEQELFRQMVEVGGYLNNQKILDVFVREVADTIPGLKQYGVPLTIADGSHYHLENYPNGPQKNLPGIYNVVPGPGRPLSFNLTLPLLETAQKLGVEVLDHVLATRILVTEGCAVGAIALNLKTGQLLVISAKAVIIATGGCARIYERSDNPVGLTGDGFYLGFQAGADLVNMEFMAFNPLKITPQVIDMIKSGKPNEELMGVGRAHYSLGGILVDTRAESTLKNLFAAGEVADGLLGAARLGATALADAIVFGTIAGREAGTRVTRVSRNDVLLKDVAEERERIEGLSQGGEASSAELQKEVKSVMWRYAGMAKNEQSLSEAHEKLTQLKAIQMKVSSDIPSEIGQAIEAHLMACVGEMIVVSSLQRRETRGQFWRLDYPLSDNVNCLFNVVISRHGDVIETRRKNVVMTRMRTPSVQPLVGCGCFNYLKPFEKGKDKEG